MKETLTKTHKTKDAFRKSSTSSELENTPSDDQTEGIPVYKQSPPDKLKEPRKKLHPAETRYADVPFDMID